MSIMSEEQKIIDLENEIVDLQTKLEIEKIDNKYNQEERDEETIPKYKIREKIKELEGQMQQDEVDEFGIHSIGWEALDYVVEQLKELLEEN